MPRITVNTPKGEKYHGDWEGDTFTRKVRKDKDFMRIYESYSIHPKIIEKANAMNLKKLRFVDENNTYEISIDDAREHGFQKTHAGGPTYYLQLKHLTTV